MPVRGSSEVWSCERSLKPLVELAAARILLGVDVAAAKFANGQRITAQEREREILDWAAGQLNGARAGHAIGLAFFGDQITASKVVQAGLHARWREHPEELPAHRRDLVTQIRPELDVINQEMLSLLANMEEAPSAPLGALARRFDQMVSASPSLRQLPGLRHAAADVALRSLRPR